MGQQHLLCSHLAMDTDSQKVSNKTSGIPQLWQGCPQEGKSEAEWRGLYLLEQRVVNAQTWKGFLGECKGLWSVTESGSGAEGLEKSLSQQYWEQICAESLY